MRRSRGCRDATRHLYLVIEVKAQMSLDLGAFHYRYTTNDSDVDVLSLHPLFRDGSMQVRAILTQR